MSKEKDDLLHRIHFFLCAQFTSGEASKVATAEHFGLTGRQLSLRLRARGYSFRQVLNATRLELARSYLAAGMSAEAVSFELGFSDPPNFYRAFKRWTGTTPGDYRSQVPGE